MIEKLRDYVVSLGSESKAREEFVEAKFLVYASALIVAVLVLYLGCFDGRVGI
ncbi:MAG: hypothetical protein ACR2IE_11070 [Candidatus Sumerlaeaceae bacterium]